MKKKNKLTNKFGIEVKKRLLEMGMKQIELAELVGTSQRYLNHMLCGYRNPNDDYIEKIEKALEISLEGYKKTA